MQLTLLESPLPGCRLWRFDLDAAPAPAWLDALSGAEHARAARFAFARDRHRYLAAHAAVRQLLADATGLPARALDFDEGAYGKPALTQAPALHFNLSHSQHIGVLALSCRAAVGIDVEVVRPVPDALDLADAHFDDGERRALRALPEGAARERAFLRCWTRKEACLKALGTGLSGIDSRNVDAGVDDGRRALNVADGAQVHRLQLVSMASHDDALLSLALHVETSRASGARAPAAVGPCAEELLA